MKKKYYSLDNAVVACISLFDSLILCGCIKTGAIPSDKPGFYQDGNIAMMGGIILGAEVNSNTGNCIDLNKGEVFNLNKASLNDEYIDFVFLYSGGTSVNFFTPDSDFSGWPAVNDKIIGWDQRNEGELLRIPHSMENPDEMFDSVKYASEIVNAIRIAKDNMKNAPDYSIYDGPGKRIRSISLGDIIYFVSKINHVVAVIRVREVAPGHNGSIKLDIKSAIVDN